MADVQLNDIGTIFRVTLLNGTSALDVSSATATKDLIFTAPSGAQATRAASFTTDGTTGKIEYISLSGNIDEVGEWQIQASVVITAGTFKSGIVKFDVGSNL